MQWCEQENQAKHPDNVKAFLIYNIWKRIIMIFLFIIVQNVYH